MRPWDGKCPPSIDRQGCTGGGTLDGVAVPEAVGQGKQGATHTFRAVCLDIDPGHLINVQCPSHQNSLLHSSKHVCFSQSAIHAQAHWCVALRVPVKIAIGRWEKWILRREEQESNKADSSELGQGNNEQTRKMTQRWASVCEPAEKAACVSKCRDKTESEWKIQSWRSYETRTVKTFLPKSMWQKGRSTQNRVKEKVTLKEHKMLLFGRGKCNTLYNDSKYC